MGIENPIHLLFIGVVALLVLGPRRLPGLARALGHGVKEFREAISQGGEAPSEAPHTLTPPQPPPQQTPTPAQSPPAQTVDPVEPLRSGDAPDRRPL
jgi:sec-independent protein translocase protein TatA